MTSQFIERLPYYLYGEIAGIRRVLYTIAHDIDPEEAFVEVRVLGEWAFRAKAYCAVPLPGYTVSSNGQVMTAVIAGALPSFDTVGLVLGDVVFLDDPATTSNIHNGLWIITRIGDPFTQWELTRAGTADEIGEITPGSIWFIEQGLLYGQKYFSCTNVGDITPGVTPITWTTFVSLAIGYCNVTNPGIVKQYGGIAGKILTNNLGSPGGDWVDGLYISPTLIDFQNTTYIIATGNPTWRTGTGNFVIDGQLFLAGDPTVKFNALIGDCTITQEVPAYDTPAYYMQIKAQPGGQQSVGPTGKTGGVMLVNGGTGGAASGPGGNAGIGGETWVKGGAAGAAPAAVGAQGGHLYLEGGVGTGAFNGGSVFMRGGDSPGGHGGVYIGATNTSILSFGNGTDNPLIQFLGTGHFTVAGPTYLNNSAFLTGTLYFDGPGIVFDQTAGNITINQPTAVDDTAGSYTRILSQPGGAQVAAGTGGTGGSVVFAAGGGGISKATVGGIGGVGGIVNIVGGAGGDCNGRKAGVGGAVYVTGGASGNDVPGLGAKGGAVYITGGFGHGGYVGGIVYIDAGATDSAPSNASIGIGTNCAGRVIIGNAVDATSISLMGDVAIDGKVGFYGTASQPQPTITGSKGGNAALASLLTALADLGLIIDSTS